jgi:hypothetical protein
VAVRFDIMRNAGIRPDDVELRSSAFLSESSREISLFISAFAIRHKTELTLGSIFREAPPPYCAYLKDNFVRDPLALVLRFFGYVHFIQRYSSAISFFSGW